MISSIRGNSVTSAFGNHLQNDCTGTDPDWSNVQDQQIPDALEVQQSTTTSTGSTSDARRLGIGWSSRYGSLMGIGLAIAVLGHNWG
jgi:hypothetical protein